MIDTAVGGSSSFTITISIKKIIEAIAANGHIELYDRCTSKLGWAIDLKLVTHAIKLEDQVVTEVEKRLKELNLGT